MGFQGVNWYKRSMIFIYDHALYEETKDNVGSLIV
jgi:hypothetical protein